MTPIEERVIAEATQQANGRWIFEGKDTQSWFVLAEAQHLAADLLGANESYLIAGRLFLMDRASS